MGGSEGVGGSGREGRRQGRREGKWKEERERGRREAVRAPVKTTKWLL